MKKNSAFTIVEIVIVIAIIAILSSIAIITFSSVRRDSRDATRESNATVVSEALEKYYEKNGEYPSVASIANTETGNTGEVVASRLSIPATSLIMPNMPSTATNAIIPGTNPQNDYLAYEATSAQNNASCQNDTNGGCDTFKLRYLAEGADEIREITSRHAWRSTDSTPELTVASTGVSSISAAWTEIPTASTYTLQRSLSPDMSSPVTSTHSSISTTVTDLTVDTEYFFIVRASTPNGMSDWSEVQSATTSSVTAPTGTITVAAVMSGTNARGTASGGMCGGGTTIEYQIRYRVNSEAWNGWVNGTPRDIPATEGSTYTFQAQARCKAGSIGGPWVQSTTAATTRSVTAPTGLIISATMSGVNARGTASGGACATGTTVEHQIRYEATSTATAGSWSSYVTGTPRDVTANQGWRYTFQQQARCVGVSASSSWVASDTASIVRPITYQPGAPTVSVGTSNSTTTPFSWNTTTGCPTGTTARYQYRYGFPDISYLSAWNGPSAGMTSYDMPTSSQGYIYDLNVQTHCSTTHSTGPWSVSGSQSYLRPITTPGAPTNFTVSIPSDRMYLRISYDHPSCGPGTQQQHRFGMWIATNTKNYGWLPGAYSGWRNQTAPNWDAAGIGNWVNYKQINSGDGKPIPTAVGHRLKLQYRCTNVTTGRSSALGPETLSPILNS